MNTGASSEFLNTSLERVHGWIKAVDAKISILLTFQGVIVTLIAGPIMHQLLSLKHHDWKSFLVLFFIVLGGEGILIGIYRCASTLISQVKNKNESLIFFGDIAEITLETLKKKLSSYSKEDERNDLMNQIHVSSRIARNKHSQFSSSVKWFLMGVAFISLGIAIKYIAYVLI